MCTDKSPKAFVLSAGIQKLPITWLSVDNFDDRVLCYEPTSINHNIHGCFLCRYRATGWFWWISGLRAVAMWSSSSFTKKWLEVVIHDWNPWYLLKSLHCVRSSYHTSVQLGDTCMLHWIWSSLVQVMACHILNAKPLKDSLWLIANWTLKKKSLTLKSNYKK